MSAQKTRAGWSLRGSALPMPARYVIAPDGIIAYAEINPGYTRRPEPSDLFPVLESRRPADGVRGVGGFRRDDTSIRIEARSGNARCKKA